MARTESDDRLDDRREMLRAVADSARETAAYTGRSEFSPAVMAALEAVPRHEFLPDGERAWAYLNTARPIDCGQTISQPYIVALMTDLLDCRPEMRVLEIGTGSGYQAAVLSLLVAEVVSLEVIPELADTARRRLARLGYRNVAVHCADGDAGWPARAPYDGILVTAAAPAVPPPLFEQLAPGGRLLIPVGPAGGFQELCCIEKTPTGQRRERSILPVAFVPITHGPTSPAGPTSR